MFSNLFNRIDSLQAIINSPHLQSTRPNVAATQAQIQALTSHIESLLDGMGVE